MDKKPGINPTAGQTLNSKWAKKHGSIRWFKRLLWVFAALLLLTAFALFAFYLYVAKDLPTAAEFRDSCLSMKIADPGAAMYPRRLEEMPPLVIKAFLAAEDSNYYRFPARGFWSYFRVNYYRTFGPIVFYEPSLAHLLAMRANTVLWERWPNPWGRIYGLTREALLAARLERELTKDEVLEIYLNRVYLGRGASGVEAAARILLGKTITEVSIAEAAQLAALQRARPVNEVLNNQERLKERKLYVLDRMLDLEYITEEQFRAAKEEEVILKTEAQ